MIVADNETAVDLLLYEPIAQTVVRLVRERSHEPLSVGIHGDWGAGKSSILIMIEEAFASDNSVLCVRFNGWVFQGFEDAKAVLIETIVDELLRSRSTSAKVKDQARRVLRRVDWMKLVRKAGAYGITAATGLPHPETVRDLGVIADTLLEKGKEAVTPEAMTALVAQAGNYTREVAEDGAPEQMHAFREEFEALLKDAAIDRLVVLVDDLDRCLPGTAIETLEAIRLFLFVPRAAFVIAADEGMIEYAVRQHFPDLPVATGPATYARNYLEKLIQVPFRLPSLGYSETRIYVTLLLAMRELGEGSEEFAGLVQVARGVLRRPWKGEGLTRDVIEKELGSVPEGAEASIALAGQIARILADGARGNPRQIKRFINTMMLRLAIAEERGFGDDLDLAVLAKVMLAERFAPEFYDAMARGSANTGFSDELTTLEGFAFQDRTAGRETKAAGDGPAARVDEASLPDWPNLEWAKQWAAIEPGLSERDLRPYVFVTKDRRNVPGAPTSLGELEELLMRLQGSPLQARQASTEVARLPTVEAERLFDALAARVRGAESLKEAPPAATGLAEVCRHHAFLRGALVSFLKGLPMRQIGPWVVSGWGAALADDNAKADFKALLQEWSGQDENGQLKAAATGASKMGSRRKPR